MLDTIGTLRTHPGDAWLYHSMASPLEQFSVGERHEVSLDPAKEWCITHRPAERCTCGQYAVEWPTA